MNRVVSHVPYRRSVGPSPLWLVSVALVLLCTLCSSKAKVFASIAPLHDSPFVQPSAALLQSVTGVAQLQLVDGLPALHAVVRFENGTLYQLCPSAGLVPLSLKGTPPSPHPSGAPWVVLARHHNNSDRSGGRNWTLVVAVTSGVHVCVMMGYEGVCYKHTVALGQVQDSAVLPIPTQNTESIRQDVGLLSAFVIACSNGTRVCFINVDTRATPTVSCSTLDSSASLSVAIRHGSPTWVAHATADRVVLSEVKISGSRVQVTWQRTWFVSNWNVVELQYNTSVGAMIGGNISVIRWDQQWGALWVGTDRCIDILLPDLSWRRLDAFRSGLPYANVTAFSAVTVPVGVGQQHFMLAGTTRGLVLYDYETKQFRCLCSSRYLRHSQNVTALVAWQELIVVATTGSVMELRLSAWTLAEKVAHLQEQVYPRHNRHGLVADCALRVFGDAQSWKGKCGDNDGQFTGLYVASQAYRYAVTADPRVKQAAWQHVQALQMLHNMTGIKGFFGRTFFHWAAGETCDFGHGRWYNSSVMPGWTFKGDTSSDEVCGHMYALPLAHDLLAETDEERAMIRNLIDTVMSWIIANNFTLVGPTHRPTTWGKWDPDYVNHNASARDDRGRQSLEMLTWLMSAYRLTSKDIYVQAIRELMSEVDQYSFNAINTATAYPLDFVAFDHGLSFLVYQTFIWACNHLTVQQRQELPDELFLHVNRSLERTYRFVQRERNTEYALTYASAKLQTPGLNSGFPVPPTGAISFDAAVDVAQDLSRGVDTLRQWVLDEIDFPVDNSQRHDVHLNPYDPTRQAINEVDFHRWGDDPFKARGGTGYFEYEPTAPIATYWKLRWHKWLL